MDIWEGFNIVLLSKKVVNLCGSLQIWNFRFRFALSLFKTIGLTICTIIFALGGVIIGSIAGAMKGHTTETGLCRGAAIGFISGAIVTLELLDSILNGHFLSKVALFGSLFNGKAFREWVSPAVLKAYQWQTSMNESSGNGSDIYSIDEIRGMPLEFIKKLPMIHYRRKLCKLDLPLAPTGVCCAICLQDLVEGEKSRKLPGCEHLFHLTCVDTWLARNSSCPVCRNRVYSEK